MVSKLKTLGFDPFIVGSSEAASKTKTVDEVAKEVVQGLWGNGSERKSAIEKAGYDYAEVQKRVNALL